VLATALSIHLLKTGEGLLHACISSILLIFHERALIVHLTFTIKTTRVRNMADFVKPTTAIKLQFWKDTIFFLFIVYRQSLASSAGLSMGFSLRMGFEKKNFWERGLP
jgi:hypothetical protein